MKKIHKKILCLLLFLIISSILSSSFVSGETTKNNPLQGIKQKNQFINSGFAPFFRWNPRKITLKYDMHVTNNDTKTVNITTYLAKPKSSIFQEIQEDVLYNIDPDGFLFDQWNQEVAYYCYTLSPNQNITFSWQLNATIYSVRYFLLPMLIRGEIPEDITENYTGDAPLYKINDPLIQGIVEQQLKNIHNPLFKVLKLHRYVIHNLKYSLDGRWDDAVTVLNRGNGSCSEYCFVFIALCRAAGIPARYNGGSIYNSPTPHIDTVYHRISEVYFPNYGWVPIDVTWDDTTIKHYYFGLHVNKLFTLTIGGGPSDYLNWSYHYWQDVTPHSDNIIVKKSITWLNWDRVWSLHE